MFCQRKPSRTNSRSLVRCVIGGRFRFFAENRISAERSGSISVNQSEAAGSRERQAKLENSRNMKTGYGYAFRVQLLTKEAPPDKTTDFVILSAEASDRRKV